MPTTKKKRPLDVEYYPERGRRVACKDQVT